MRLRLAAMVSIGVLASAIPCVADTDARPISVPLLGTQGVASRYPSTLLVNGPGGPMQQGQVRVTLHKVTHPCPEHLAVLLVQASAPGGKYLLMSNAGGCRPLVGTDIIFSPSAGALPDSEPSDPPNNAARVIGASNYGTVPTFPDPAPAGPYTLGLPPANGLVTGAWQLFVMDTTEGGRGVIAGGWSLQYDSTFLTNADQTSVNVPFIGTGPGIAAVYPITFDLTGARADAQVQFVYCSLTLGHSNPDDLRIILQSPAGTAVALMISAGGAANVPSPTTVNFTDFGTLPVSDNGPLIAGTYRPGGVYGNPTGLPLPAPPAPYATTLATFNGEPVTGTWKLFVFDDNVGNIGTIASASLYIGTLGAPQISISTPAAATIATQPFVRVEGDVANAVPGPATAYSATWRVFQGANVFYDAGAFTFRSGSNTFSADVPVKDGTNTIVITVVDRHGQTAVTSRTVSVNEFTYSLAEGATGGFFDTDVVIGNTTNAAVPVTLDFLPESSAPVSRDAIAGAQSPLTVHVDDIVGGDAVSTVVHSTHAVPLAVERTMSWDARGYGGHGGSATAPATEWLFAEGSQGYFDTYVLLANGGAAPADVNIRFLLEGGGVVQQAITVPALSRRTIDAGGIAALVNQSFGIDILSTQPIIAERAMYFPHGSPRVFEGGHESAGVNDTSRNWFLAEGATGPFFESFVLLMNPTATDANVTLTYLLPDGSTVTQPLTVAANSRRTVDIETVDAQLANVAVSTRVTSDVGIVAERAMYWPDVSQGWQEAHNSFGVTDLGLRWGLADGRLGGARGYETYVLLANPNTLPSEVIVRFTRPGALATRTYTLPPTSRLSIWTSHDVPELGEGSFNVEVAVVNYVPIAVEKAMYWNADGAIWAAGTNVTATRLPPP